MDPEEVVCGLCETPMEKTDIEEHECIAEYQSVVIHEDTRYFYPRNDDGTVVRQNLMPQKNITSCVLETTTTSDSDLEELLISMVRIRPALWDYSLPIVKRGRNKIKQLWEEISEEIGILSAVEAQKKWKTLKDTFLRLLSNEKKLKMSGAGAQPKKKKWKYFEDLSFLRDIPSLSETISSESLRTDEQPTTSGVQSNISKKKSNDSKIDAALQNIAESLKQPLPPVAVPQLPPIPVVDEIEAFGIQIVSKLRQLDNRKRIKLMNDMFTMLSNAQLE